MGKRIMGLVRWGIQRNWRKLVLGVGVAGLAVLAFCWGRSGAQCQTVAAAPGEASCKPGDMVPEAPLAPESGSDYSRRVVAYIHKNIPITREDLGEFLIARYGMDKVEALVNRRIVDMACQARGIQVTEAEVKVALEEDLRGLGNLTPSDFEKKLLKPRNTSLYQWREDVIRPKLALTQYCRDRIKVTEEDIQNAFENHYGPKVKCRMILIPKVDGHEDRHRFELRAKVCKDPVEFDKAARGQPVQALAAKEGEIPPICKHCGDERIERTAFSLDPGEVSGLIDTPDGTIILKCVERLPADSARKLDKERDALQKEIFDQKIMQEIPKVLKELRAQAEPQFFFKRPQTAGEMMKSTLQASGEMPGATQHH